MGKASETTWRLPRPKSWPNVSVFCVAFGVKLGFCDFCVCIEQSTHGDVRPGHFLNRLPGRERFGCSEQTWKLQKSFCHEILLLPSVPSDQSPGIVPDWSVQRRGHGSAQASSQSNVCRIRGVILISTWLTPGCKDFCAIAHRQSSLVQGYLGYPCLVNLTGYCFLGY